MREWNIDQSLHDLYLTHEEFKASAASQDVENCVKLFAHNEALVVCQLANL